MKKKRAMTLGKIQALAIVDRACDAALFSAIALAILGGLPALLAWWADAGYEWWRFSAILWMGTTFLGLSSASGQDSEVPAKRLSALDNDDKRDLAQRLELPENGIVTLASIDALIAKRWKAREAERRCRIGEAQKASLG